MTYCINPQCAQPQNSTDHKTCQTCGHDLLLQGKYAAIKKIGAGGFGRTFLAVDCSQSAKPRCVIKQLFSEGQNTHNQAKALDLFRQEAEQLKRLGKHPQIPDCLDSFADDDHQYIIQEFVDGHNLDQQLKSHGLFTEIQVFKLLLEILPLLEFIHQKGVIHRDMKPANIIYRQIDGSLWLVDLGAAKQLTGTALAQTSTVIGSAEFTAPEQARGKATFASDIYSLGVTCIYLLTGVSPFNLYDTGDSRWVWQDFLPKAVNPDLANLLDKMIQMSTNKRYQTIQDVQADLAILVKSNQDNSSSSDLNTVLSSKQSFADQQHIFHEGKDSDTVWLKKNPQTNTLESDISLKRVSKPTQSPKTSSDTVWLGNNPQASTLEPDISFEQAGDLRQNSQTSSVRPTKDSEASNNKNLIAKSLLLLIIGSFIGPLFAYFSIYSNSSEGWGNDSGDLSKNVKDNSTSPPLFDYSSDNPLETTSADWHVKTYALIDGLSFSKTTQDSSKIGFVLESLATSNSIDNFFWATWKLKKSIPTTIELEAFSGMNLELPPTFGTFSGGDNIFVIDQKNNELKIFDALTGEPISISAEQNISIADLAGSELLPGYLTMDITQSFAQYIRYDWDGDTNSSVTRIWDLREDKLLSLQEYTQPYEQNWPVLLKSQDWESPFSVDGHWMIVFDEENLQVDLWDLQSKKKVIKIDADAVTFSSNKDILIVEDHSTDKASISFDQLPEVKLLDLTTQQYILQSHSVERIALHPHRKIVAIFNGQQISLDDISGAERKRLMNLGEYPTLQKLKFSPDGNVLVGQLNHQQDESYLFEAGELIFWDVRTGKILEKPQKIGGKSIPLHAQILFSPDSQKVLLISETGHVDNFSGTSEQFIQIWQVPQP